MMVNGYIRNAHVVLPLPQREGVEYRRVPGWSGYAIGTDGTVLSQKSGTRWKPVAVWGRQGYRFAGLCKDKGQKAIGIHRLLLWAFVGPCPPGMQCRHLDGNRSNNNLSNLAWGTSQENANDRIRHGHSGVGEQNPIAKLTEAHAATIKLRLAQEARSDDLASEFGVSVGTIRAINEGRLWKGIPSPIGRYPIRPDGRKSPHRKKRVYQRGYKCRVSEAERAARRERAKYMRQFIGKKKAAAPGE